MAFLGNVGLVLLIKSLCVLNVAFRVLYCTSEFRTVFTWKYLQPLFSANYVEKDQKVYYPRLTQDIEKADIPDGRGNGQIIQNRTQKKKICLRKMEALKWP